MADTETSPVPRVIRWLLPSLTQWLWLMVLLILLAQPWRTVMVCSDGDTCMHWRVGEWMLQHHQIIREDVFSYTRSGQPVISKEWLSEILFALAGRAEGLYGQVVLAALVIATTFALLHRQLLREGNDLLTATMVVILAAWAASSHWLARPHAFSFLMIVLWNDALRRYERDRHSARLAVVLATLAMLWVNLHGAFLAGFFILGAYGLGAILERDWDRARTLAAVGLLCAAASLLNPSGYELHLHNLQFLRSTYLTNWLAEYRSSNFQTLGSLGFLTWLALLLLVMALGRPRIPAGGVVLLLSWGYFALFSVRNIPLFATLTAPLVAPSLSEWVRGRWQGFRKRLGGMNLSARGWPVVAVVTLVAVMPRPTSLPAKSWPIDAVEFIRQHPEQFAGNMFNQYAWGGYLMLKLPEHKVFVDGRTDFYGEGLIREFTDTTALNTNWMQALQAHHVSWTLMPADHRLNLAMALLPGWRCVYTDEAAQVFCKIQ